MTPRTVLSMEQALSLPYATLRFAQLGWRVIRIESTRGGAGLPGDPNRYIGSRLGGADRRSYFIAPNVGKEAIALNLKDPRGRQVLQRLLQNLDVDVFCCNTVPARYKALGIDAATLMQARPALIWAGISAQGPQVPDAPGYDPVLQAMAGYMEVTGDPAGPPTLTGIPVIDLKAGDEVYSSVLLALLERMESGCGKEIHVSMLQVAASWLITLLPLLDMDCDPGDITRSGNKHRKFIPTDVYPTRDGFVYLAIGSDVQWQRLTALPRFAAVANPGRSTNEGRHQQRDTIYRDIAAVTAGVDSAALLGDLHAATIPATRILDIPQVRDLLERQGKLTRTTLPDARVLRMQPMAVDVAGARTELSFPAHYGADTRSVLMEAGYSAGAVAALGQQGVVA